MVSDGMGIGSASACGSCSSLSPAVLSDDINEEPCAREEPEVVLPVTDLALLLGDVSVPFSSIKGRFTRPCFVITVASLFSLTKNRVSNFD